MTSKERILAAIHHQPPDRVPISPRMVFYRYPVTHPPGIEMEFSSVDPMFILSYPKSEMLFMGGLGSETDCDLPEVRLEQKTYPQDDKVVCERVFHTPAGRLTDRTVIPPAGKEYGIMPNPMKTEHLVKGPEDLPALRYLTETVSTDLDFARDFDRQVGDRGVVMMCIRGMLDHNAGSARSMEDLMTDYYDNRPFFDEMLAIFHRRCLRQIKASLEAGVKFIFGSWYFASVSSGWSPALFRECFIPKIRECVELAHQYGAYFDYYDDGKLNDTMAMIADTGVDVLETCTPPPVGDFDLARAKALIGGKTTLKGYIDLLYVLKRGTPEQVRQTVRQAMEIAKPGGGFIIGTSDSIREGTPFENVMAYFEACREFGKY